MHKQNLLHSAHELDVGPRRPLKPGPTASVLIEYRGEVQSVGNERHRFVIPSPKALKGNVSDVGRNRRGLSHRNSHRMRMPSLA